MDTRHAIIDTSHFATPLGDLTIVASGGALGGLYFAMHRYLPPESAFGERVDASTDAVLQATATQLAEYTAGDRTAFDLPLHTSGDVFQEKVWAMLRRIPFGQTVTYGQLAVALGNRALAQNVGQAVGHNPISVIVPCHRVVGASGKLTGYAGGLERKRALLGIEEPAAALAGRLF